MVGMVACNGYRSLFINTGTVHYNPGYELLVIFILTISVAVIHGINEMGIVSKCPHREKPVSTPEELERSVPKGG